MKWHAEWDEDTPTFEKIVREKPKKDRDELQTKNKYNKPRRGTREGK